MLDRKELRKPSNEWRAAPFWSWNDELEPGELRRQIDEMVKGGWGGYFMHSRVGLITPYLGKRWFECIKACVEHAKKTGTLAYLYDEDKWPSGFAGGEVPRKGAEYRSKALVMCVDGKPAVEGEEMGAFRVDLGAQPAVCERAKDGNVKVIAWTAPMGNRWFNDTAYVDLMSDKVVRAYVQTTHERYRKACGRDFGRAVPGIFTDEPCYIFHNHTPHPHLPWTPALPKEFKARCGYDLLPCLPSLFLPVGDHAKVRRDFFRVATELFAENFSKIIFDWCARYRCPVTGHYMAEDNLISQIQWVGAAMPHYEFMQMPGMDHLGRNIANPMTALQVSSSAHQFGHKRTLSETHGCSGHNMSMEDRKWLWDWHVALGINLECPHLWLYSMRGERKRDYPPNISCAQPYWKHNAIFGDYAGRVSYAMAQGEPEADLLLVHPIESAWATYSPLEFVGYGQPAPGTMPESLRLSNVFAGIIARLLSAQVAFEFGDESIMARRGSVKRTKDGPRLVVGKMAYKAAALPSCLTLRATTLALLEKFAKAGGKIFLFGDRPTLVDGEADSGALAALLDKAQAVDPGANLNEVFCDLFGYPLCIDPAQEGADKIYAARRKKGPARLFFLCNTDNTKGYTIEAHLAGEEPLIEVDLETGEPAKIESTKTEDGWKVKLDFAPAGSHLLMTGVKTAAKGAARAQIVQAGAKAMEIGGGDWRLRMLTPNAMTLDYARLVRPERKGLAGDRWVLDVADAVKAMNPGTPYRVEYVFEAGVVPEGEVSLVAERLRADQVLLVNGRNITGTETGKWLDVHWLKYAVSEHLQRGTNVIAIEGAAAPPDARNNPGVEIEAVYLVGHFGVAPAAKRFKMVAAPKAVKAADIQKQGLPFFAGEAEITKSFEISEPTATQLVLEEVDATVVEAILNGKSLGRLAWRPFAFAIPKETLRAGQNTLSLVLTNTLRNLMGPHHHKAGELLSVGPFSFRDKAGWTDAYSFVAYGVKKVVLS